MKTANKIVMTATGLVLIIAALLKTHQLLTEPILSTGFWESWLFFVIQIPLELGLGIWLASGLFRKAAWLIAVIGFAIFIAVTLQKGLIGAASCGCFGKIHVNPWVTLFTIDTPLFVLLLFFRPAGYKLLPPPWPSAKHFFSVAIPTFIILGTIVPVLVINKPPEKTESYEVINPENWFDSDTGSQQLALLDDIDIGDSLRTGFSVIVFYHNDCPECRKAIPIYDQMARDFSISEQGIQFAFIEAPPYGDEDEYFIPPDTPCFTGCLDDAKDWYFVTPLTVLTIDGNVVKYWQVETATVEQIWDALTEGY